MARSIEVRIENAVTWSSLLVYWAVWGRIPMTMGVPEYAWTGWLLGAVYVAGQAYEIRYRGHCYLSADATAFPAVIQAAMVLYAVLHFGFGAPWPAIGTLAASLAISFGAGHLAAIVYGALMTGLLAILLPTRDDSSAGPDEET